MIKIFYVELTEIEIDEIVNFIEGQTEDLERIEVELSDLTRGFPELTIKAFEEQPFNIQAAIMDARAALLSSVTTVLSMFSGLIQKLKSIPSKILNALSAFLRKFWKIVSKYISIFKIESITVVISVTPSVTVVLKP